MLGVWVVLKRCTWLREICVGTEASGAGQALRKLGARSSDDEVASIMKLADTNMDGHIDFAEFSAMCTKHFLPQDAALQ